MVTSLLLSSETLSTTTTTTWLRSRVIKVRLQAATAAVSILTCISRTASSKIVHLPVARATTRALERASNSLLFGFGLRHICRVITVKPCRFKRLEKIPSADDRVRNLHKVVDDRLQQTAKRRQFDCSRWMLLKKLLRSSRTTERLSSIALAPYTTPLFLHSHPLQPTMCITIEP